MNKKVLIGVIISLLLMLWVCSAKVYAQSAADKAEQGGESFRWPWED